MPSYLNHARPTVHLPPPAPEETLQWMAKLIRRGQYDQRIRELGEQITADLHPHDYLSEYAAIFNWVRVNIRYSRDPKTIEQLKTANVVLQTRTGDCDDMAVLIGSMVGQMGAGVRLTAAAFSGSNLLAHVWVEAYDPSTSAWVALDPVPGRKVGQMLGRVTRTLRQNVL